MNPRSLVTLSLVAGRAGHGLMAARDIPEGKPILEFQGQVLDHPSRTSLQLGERLHLDVPAEELSSPKSERYFWRFLNHHCRPNARVQGRLLYARRTIRKGEEITINYSATEYELSFPFECHCEDPDCLKVIRGFKHLTSAQRDALKEDLTDYLRKHLQ